jgi:sulfur-carrier protein
MQVKILYFAKLREQLGLAQETVSLHGDAWTVGALRAHLQARGGDWATSFAPGKSVRAAVNQAMADDAATVPAGAEVAFFPPVTGG